MKSNNNKIFSSLLLLTALSSMVAGALSINNNVYRKAEAASTYHVVYLSIPGPDDDHKGQVTKTNGSGAIKWDQDDDLYFFHFSDSLTGQKMSKIDDQLYAYHAYHDTMSSSRFIFTAKIGGVTYRSAADGIQGFYYNQVNSSHNLFTLNYYNTSSADAAGSWSGYSTTTADKFAKTFFAVVGDSTCLDDGTTDESKLLSAWNEMSSLYEGVTNEDEQNLLKTASINKDGTALEKFAALYNYILNKYPSYQSRNFVGRSITPLAGVNRTNITIDKGNTNMIVAISIGATSIAIVSVYFFLRKRKEK